MSSAFELHTFSLSSHHNALIFFYSALHPCQMIPVTSFPTWYHPKCSTSKLLVLMGMLKCKPKIKDLVESLWFLLVAVHDFFCYFRSLNLIFLHAYAFQIYIPLLMVRPVSYQAQKSWHFWDAPMNWSIWPPVCVPAIFSCDSIAYIIFPSALTFWIQPMRWLAFFNTVFLI